MVYLNIFMAITLFFIFLSKRIKKKNKEALKKRMQKERLIPKFTINGKPGLALPITSNYSAEFN